MSNYAQRNQILARLGYPNYSVYLASPLWRSIRSRVMAGNPPCFCCKKPAQQAHHREYTERNLKGTTIAGIVPICLDCHEAIEFSNKGNKRCHMHVEAALMRLKARYSKPAPNPSRSHRRPKKPVAVGRKRKLRQYGPPSDLFRQHTKQKRLDRAKRTDLLIIESRRATMPTFQPNAPLAARIRREDAATT